MRRQSVPTWLFVFLIVFGASIATAATTSHLTSVSQNGDGTVLNQPGGPAVTLTGNTDVYNASGGSGTTMHWNTTDGNISFQSSGSSSATIAAAEINGSWTNITSVDASGANLTVNATDKSAYTVGGQLTAISVPVDSATGIDDGQVDFVYSASGSSTVTLRSLPADTTFSAATASGEPLGQFTTDSTGTGTLSLDSASGDKVLLFTSSDPTADATSASPSGGTTVSDRNVTFEINVSDADFNNPGDNVTATFTLDGNEIGTDTTTSNGTVSTNANVSTGGSHNWSVDLEDGYGRTDSTSNFSFNAPSTLTIYNESAPSQKLDNLTATITVYPGDTGSDTQIVTRNTSDGTLDMAGLPADQPIVIAADAPGYRPRRIFVTQLYEQQRIYLLPDNETYTEVVFDIKDYSGQYPSGTTVLQVQRAIDGNWTTVLGDYFGATGEFSAQLSYNTRHRLVLRNTETGQMEVLGTYTPVTSEVEQVAVSPSTGIEEVVRPPNVDFKPGVRKLVSSDSAPVTVAVTNQSNQLESWSVDIYYVNESAGINDTLFETSSTDPSGGTVETTVNISNYTSGTVKVISTWSTSDSSGSETARYEVVDPVSGDQSLLTGLASLVSLVPDQNQGSFTAMLALVITIVGTTGIASQLRMGSEMVGAIALVFLSVFGALGWLSYDVVFVGLVAWGALVFLRRGY